ncbi:MAG: hypothetical protein EBY28_27535 [Betaproteobacteria bacterium]|nr:hypothetical protein [Betaproteobacteria bacterium]
MVVMVVRVVAVVLLLAPCVLVVQIRAVKVLQAVLHQQMLLMLLVVVVVHPVWVVRLQLVLVVLVEHQPLAQLTALILLGQVVAVVAHLVHTAQGVVVVQRQAGRVPMQQPTQVRVVVALETTQPLRVVAVQV